MNSYITAAVFVVFAVLALVGGITQGIAREEILEAKLRGEPMVSKWVGRDIKLMPGRFFTRKGRIMKVTSLISTCLAVLTMIGYLVGRW